MLYRLATCNTPGSILYSPCCSLCYVLIYCPIDYHILLLWFEAAMKGELFPFKKEMAPSNKSDFKSRK